MGDPQIEACDGNNGDQPYRTAYHFQPLKNWMNDPNGPVLHKGIYHFFYQHNPNEPHFGQGDLSWGHSTSTDLINWTAQPIALSPTVPSTDENGCWSGSITILPGEKPALLYTGRDFNKHQFQLLALPSDPSDPLLINWSKHPQNPILAPTPENRIDMKEFRDPTTAWLVHGKWRMCVASRVGERGVALLFKSEDFVNWVQTRDPLYYIDDTGMWECPDFFPVYVDKEEGAETSVLGSDVRHVFKVSVVPTQYECYSIGTYDTIKDVFVPDEDLSLINSDSGLRLDYGKFYAAKSFYDGDKKRRVLWGWVKEYCSREDEKMQGWAGIQGIPRTILLDKIGKQLVQWPIKEVEMLRAGLVHIPSKLIEGCSEFEVLGITATQADVEISFSISDFSKAEEFDASWTDAQSLASQKGSLGIGPFGLLIMASEELEEYTAIFFRIFKSDDQGFVALMCCDETRSSLNPTTDKKIFSTFLKIDPSHEDISLRTLIDHSIIESFGNEGLRCITSRVYPTLAINKDAHLYVFNYGSEVVKMKELRAWSMNKACVA